MGVDPAEKDYIVVVQCDIAMQRCSGWACEHAFHRREGGFSVYPADRTYRSLYLTCGGCCGRAVQRKLSHLAGKLRKKENIAKDRIAVQLASCITNNNRHGPPCPHLDYLRTLIRRAGLDVFETTHISPMSDQRRKSGEYAAEERVTQ